MKRCKLLVILLAILLLTSLFAACTKDRTDASETAAVSDAGAGDSREDLSDHAGDSEEDLPDTTPIEGYDDSLEDLYTGPELEDSMDDLP